MQIFGDDRLRGLGVGRGRKSRFPIDLRRRPYNTRTTVRVCDLANKVLLPTRTANSQTYHIPTSLLDYHLHSFYPRTVRDWYILPEAIVTATSFEILRI